ncbi:hypothetical protein [Methanolobus halotolerans]|uniref:Dolichyl-phosphate-mannose-protein mannosyltransferase n=1 Tax=Methanolobus halotolerans TaxID=2052935 RepID=A0A4E0Q0L2_9EURY|nr:hypothetical protein [Methanolobus halotolerans]TGC11566.1 hypothetical protein CUN85_01485 [Methanolobus halotolerans]
MFSVQSSKKFKITSLGLLVLLNIILRIPSIPHAKGRDSFFIHSLASSISVFGEARWWDHWLSVFGYYPYSYASGLPFTLSGMSQLFGIDIEKAILIYSIAFGVLTVFLAFTLAGLISNNFIFKYAMAFFFSVSPGIMLFTTWEASSRGPFMIFLPLLFFVLLKEISFPKKIILGSLSLLLLFSFHHYAIFAFVLTLVYIFLRVIFKFNSSYNFSSSLNKHSRKANYLYLFLIFSSFMYPFLTHSMITAGSRYNWLIDLLVINIRFIGPAILLAIGGIVSLSLSERKNFAQWYFLISFIFILPFIYDLTYGVYLLLLYSIVFLSVGFKNSLCNSKGNNKHAIKVISIFIVSIILVSTLFTAYYSYSRTGDYQYLWYMDERTYEFAHWVNDQIDRDSRVFMVAENNYYVRTIALQEEGLPILVAGVQGFTYGFINNSYLDSLERVPVTSSYFYSEGVYRVEERDIYRSMTWYVDNKNIKIIKNVYSLDYLIQSRTYYKRVQGLDSNSAEIIYTNGIHEIYELRYL